MTPIFICSKGRAGKSQIIKELNEKKADFYLFIEPQEVSVYAENYTNANIIDIEVNNKGLPYVRQYMLKYALNNNLELYWNLDDDIKLYTVVDGKCIASGYEILYEAEKLFADNNSVAQAGLEYRQYAWSSKKDFTYNSYCDCVVAIKPKLCKDLIFDEKVLLKLDRDFTIQVIRSGFKSIKISKYCFSSPENGTNEGGLYDVYKANIEEQNSLAMQNKWGENICQAVTKENGRKDVKINWKNINSFSLF
jgi:hypothetical protein